MRKCMVFFIAVCILLSSAIVVSATDTEMMIAPGKILSEEEKNESASYLNLVVLNNDDFKRGLCAFAVSNTGNIAVAMESIEQKYVYVYDENGSFQYGYRFKANGAYRVAFAGENIAIYLIRGNTFVIYDPAGNCIAEKELIYPDTELISQFIHRTSIQQADKTYSMERDVELSNNFARLVVTDSDGNRKIVYDISAQHSFLAILELLGIVGFFALAIIGIYKQHKKVESMEGIWYCRELKLQVSLDDYQNAFFVENGEKILCKCYLSSNGTGVLEVFCREYEHPKYRYGETIFVGDVRNYENMSMRVFGRRSRREYTFVRTDKVESIP